jgi:hypothetical protein
MGKDERKGARRDRNQRISKRIPELGYYFVVTDTQATESNYLNDSEIPFPIHCATDWLSRSATRRRVNWWISVWKWRMSNLNTAGRG